MSVPARMKFWSWGDLRAGHARRYEKAQLISLLEENGFEIVQFANYGFPFMNITRRLRQLLVHKPIYDNKQYTDKQELTEASGIDRAQEYKFKRFIPFRLMQWLIKCQRFFYNRDLGEGYLVVAKKK